jgi:hypothetical protein
MPVRLNGSTSGFTELSAPPVAGNNSITFPTTSGTAVVNGANSAIVSGTAVASTSGTSIDFTGIPSWVKRVTVMFNGVSTNGGSSFRIQIGAGSVDTGATYSGGKLAVLAGTSAANAYTNAAGYELEEPTGSRTAATTRFGRATITLISGNNWVLDSTICCTGTNTSDSSAGIKALSGPLDRVRITTANGTDTFDAGSINILYE